jgi:hypothetical protein
MNKPVQSKTFGVGINVIDKNSLLRMPARDVKRQSYKMILPA